MFLDELVYKEKMGFNDSHRKKPYCRNSNEKEFKNFSNYPFYAVRESITDFLLQI